MTSLRRFKATDIFRFNQVNLDTLTETYGIGYYQHYLARWPNYFVSAEAPGGNIAGYMMGKAEGRGTVPWHGHISAVTVAADYRRLGLARVLMNYIEQVSDQDSGMFVDLYVRASNAVAIKMYEQFGYVKYRQVLGYYSGEEDAYDMRKALSLDPEKKSMIPLPHPVPPGEYD